MPRQFLSFLLIVLLILWVSDSVHSAPSFDQPDLSDDASPVVVEGFQISEFGKEPVVRNPAALAFDRYGRLFVAQGPQFRYPKPDTPGDEILILEDTNGDGVADKEKQFAYGFNNIQSLAWRGGDLWVANAPDLTVVRDLDGDDVADEYSLVFTGIGTLEHGLHGLNWAPDGRLYLSKGDTPVHPHAPKVFRDLSDVPSDDPDTQPVKTFNSPDSPDNPYRANYIKPTDPHTEGGILRCGEMGENLEIFSRGMRNPYDLCFDTEFNWFGTDNDQDGGDKIMMPFYGAQYGHRHPWTYQWTGEDHTPTVPASGPFFHGSGTGVAFSSSPHFPEAYRNVFFIGDWLQMKVYVHRPTWEGALMKCDTQELEVFAENGDEESLFRPTDLAIGPEGALYISGWGKEYGAKWSEDREQGNAGRVYKIQAEGKESTPWITAPRRKRPHSDWTFDQLIEDLDSDLLVWRVDAQDELTNRSSTIKPQLEEALSSKTLSKSQRTWAAWSLGRMELEDESIDRFFVEVLKEQGHPLDLRLQALRILGYRTTQRPGENSLPAEVVDTLKDSNPRLRFEAVQAIWQSRHTPSLDSLVQSLAKEEDRIAYYSLWQALEDLIPIEERKSLLRSSSEPKVRLGLLLGMLENKEMAGDEVVQVLQRDTDPEVQEWAATWTANVGHGLEDPSQVIDKLLDLNQRGINYELRMNLLKTLERMEVSGENWTRLHDGFYQDHRRGEIFVPEKSQEAALCLLVLAQDPWALTHLWEGLSHEWEPVRLAAIKGFQMLGDTGRGELLNKLTEIEESQLMGAIESLRGFNYTKNPWEGTEEQVATIATAFESSTDPLFRQKALNLLLSADARTWEHDRTRDHAVRLAQSAVTDPDPRIYQLAEGLGQKIGENIEAVKRDPATIEDVLAHLDEANPENGHLLFYQVGGRAACYSCHRVGGEGKTFAPDLSDVGSRLDPRTVVESILQPNATITEGYRAQLIETEDGELLTGVPVGETDSMLRFIQSDGSAIPIDKRDIVERRNLDTSIMPDNMTELLTSEEVADISAWLLDQRGPSSLSQ